MRESGKQQVCCEVPGNSYWAKVSLSKPGDFSISLGEEDGRSIRLECVNGVTGLRTQGVKSENIGFVSDVEKVTEIEIFVDRRLVEVYLNGGEGAARNCFISIQRMDALRPNLRKIFCRMSRCVR